MNIPMIQTECNGNLVTVNLGYATLWFSYNTMIAFHFAGQKKVVSENVWSKTTGKHLNMLSDKKDRVPYTTFLVEFKKMSKEM